MRIRLTTDLQTLPQPIRPLPNQRPLPFDDDEARRQARLFESGDDLPGAGERHQRIIWDVAADD